MNRVTHAYAGGLETKYLRPSRDISARILDTRREHLATNNNNYCIEIRCYFRVDLMLRGMFM